jgi:polar amino acid transport system substrate-binding protein
MRTRLTALLAALAIIAMGAFVAGCGGDDDDDNGGETAAAEGELSTIEPGKLIVGSDIPYPPFEQGRDPNYEGLDIDLVNEIGKRLGLTVEIQDTSFDTIFRDLAQGKFDMVASATTITPEREKTVTFSDPYFLADQSVMVKKGSDIQTVDDLAGRTVGAQKGTTGADYAEEQTEASSVRTYAEIGDAFNALEAGQVEAVINDCPISKYAERAHPNLVVIQALPTGENYGFVFQKDATDLVEAANGALAEMTDDGTYDAVVNKWLETDPCKSITTAEG